MIRDADFDRILTGWLSEGPERAPANDVAAALAIVEWTPQRRRWAAASRWRQWMRSLTQTRLALILAVLLLVLAAVAIGVGAGLIRLPSSTQDTKPPGPNDTSLRPIQIEDWPVELSAPSTWTEIEGPCCNYRQFAGVSPEGHLSIGHESPFWTTVCSPDCRDIELPMTIPYSADVQLDALKRSVAEIAGSASWIPLGPDVLPQVEGGVRLETTGRATDGRMWRRVHIVGMRERNVVAIAFSQPEDKFDKALMNSLLASIELKPAPVYSDGDLTVPAPGETAGDFAMPMPGLWFTSDQPSLDGVPLTGVTRFAEGRVVVSFGDAEGTVGLCDPDCRQLRGQTSLDAFDQSIRDGRRIVLPAVSTTLGGEPAISIETGEQDSTRYVVAIHDQRPVVLMLNAGDWLVGPGIVDAMVAGFRFTDQVAEPVTQTFTVLDGRATLGLSDFWTPLPDREDEFNLRRQRLSVRAGSDDGTILTCELPVGDWERCREVRATNLADLEAAIQPGPLGEGEHLISERREVAKLDGEPCVITTIQAFESASRGLEEVVYIVAIHDGRPYILRIRTTANRVRDLQSVLAGFRFVD